jgi:radical SAM protein with 4Fe4S-binding SPASM domain
MNPLDKAKTSKTFCILPWVHQYVGPPGDVKPCCLYEQDMQIGDLKQNTLEEIWNNDSTKQMRLDMLNGVELPGCAKCNSRANLTTTHKDQFNAFLFNNHSHKNLDLVASTHEDGSLDNHQLQYIDVRFNNLCNLKCRTCGPRFSTSWIEDHAAMYNIQPADRLINGDVFTFGGQTEDQLITEILPHLPNVMQVYFAGGEPLMQKEHYIILEELIRLGRATYTPVPGHPRGADNMGLQINYNTNFSSLKLGKYNVIDLWKQFTSIRLNASIDGSYARAELWRKGTNWQTIVKNAQTVKLECPHIDLNISYTLSWVNAFNLAELHKEWVELGLLGVNNIHINILDVPACYSLKSIPNWKKDKIKANLEAHIQWMESLDAWQSTINGFKNAITFMYSVDHGDDFIDQSTFINLTNALDNLREENFWAVFPEHADMKVFDV